MTVTRSNSSVALCTTYRGARFLRAQLDSIAAQTVLPDELVVCDDASSDASPELTRLFAATAPLALRLEVNPRNLGTSANFDQAIGLCRGDLVFLSDQDDWWLSQKVEKMLDVFAARPDVGLVFTDAIAVDEQGESLDYRLWDAILFNRRERRQVQAGGLFPVLLKHNVVSGSTLAFRAQYRNLVLPIPPRCHHDPWIALLISAVAPCIALAEPLSHYRQHPTQQLGERPLALGRQYQIAKRQTVEGFAAVARTCELAAERLWQFRHQYAAESALLALREKAEHFRSKVLMRTNRQARLPLIVRELRRGRYVRDGWGWKSLSQDLFL